MHTSPNSRPRQGADVPETYGHKTVALCRQPPSPRSLLAIAGACADAAALAAACFPVGSCCFPGVGVSAPLPNNERAHEQAHEQAGVLSCLVY